MTHEVETKVLDIDAPVVLAKLRSLGAKQVQDTRLKVTWFHFKGVKRREDPWFLRIRSDSDGLAEATWKAKSDILGTTRKHKEINFTVGEPEKLADLFGELGLEAYAEQEKDRVSFTFKHWRFDLDTYPQVPPFLEIEGMSEGHVNEAVKLLGLSAHHTWAKGERMLIEDVYGLDWYTMKFDIEK